MLIFDMPYQAETYIFYFKQSFTAAQKQAVKRVHWPVKPDLLLFDMLQNMATQLIHYSK